MSPPDLSPDALAFRQERDREEFARRPTEHPNGNGANAHLSNELVTKDQAALEFARRHAGALRYCHNAGKWYEWTNSVWKQNQTALAFQFARELAASETDRVRYMTSKTAFASGVEKFARSDPAFAVTAADWDKDPYLLGTPAGTVDLRTGLLRPSDPADGITRSTAIVPATHADCPQWLAFLNDATNGDAEMMRFLQQWSGYCLTGDVSEHAFAFIHGAGGNGKGVLLNTTAGILGEYHKTAPIETFTASNTDHHPTDLAGLRGARLVSASETEEGRRWAESRIKQLTGGDVVSARLMRQDFFEYRPQYKLTIIGNHKPRLRNVGDAMQRRINIIPFVHKPLKPDPQLEEKLKAEWPAILRWEIDGCLDWQKNRLVRPTSVKKATGKYFADQDILAQWLEEECDAEPGNRWKMAAVGELFQSWVSYAKAAGAEAGSQVEFSEKMEIQGFEKHRGAKGKRVWRGVCLRAKEQEE
jgi:putative DNA primase/helicase